MSINTSKSLKYSREIRGVQGCPPANVEHKESCFRIVNSNKGNPDNFLPTAVLYPGRYDNDNDASKCRSWALSMFESLDQLKKHFGKMLKSNPNWGKMCGDHYTRLKVSSTHGQRTAARNDGHFSFHEYANCDLTSVADDPTPL